MALLVGEDSGAFSATPDFPLETLVSLMETPSWLRIGADARLEKLVVPRITEAARSWDLAL